MKRNEPRVALIMDHNSTYGREVTLGIARYVRSHKPWRFAAHALGAMEPVPDLASWRGDGIIAQIATRVRLKEILALRIPTVNISGALEKPPVPTVRTDTDALGQLVFDHFAARGFRHYAYLGYFSHSLSELRAKPFADAVEQAGFQCHFYTPQRKLIEQWEWDAMQADIAKWLQELPKPIGVLAVDDNCARRIAEACTRVRIPVPEDVAIVGINNDVLVCELNNPPLSSVDLQAEQIGFEAAKLLETMMDGARPPKEPIQIAPATVIVRLSSDVMAVSDTTVAAALRYIHDNINQPLYVDEIAKAAHASRRLLERKFRKEVGTTINREIGKVRLQRVKQLLASTDKPIPDVAAASGFAYVQQLNQIFKRATGLTPTNFRKRYRMA